MNKWTRLFMLGTVATVALTACGAQTSESPTAGQGGGHENHGSHQHQLANGDTQETTASVNTLPTFLSKADPKIKLAYQTAAKHNDMLQFMPCYCGCGISAAHKNNANCFIKEVQADGSVVWDDHGTRCDTCMNIAMIAANMKEQGKSTYDIRTAIDAQFKEGFAKPTPTPMPSKT